MQFPFKTKSARGVRARTSWQQVAFRRARIATTIGIALHTPFAAAETFRSTQLNFELHGLIEPQERMSPGKAIVLVSRGMTQGLVIGSEQHYKAIVNTPSYCTDFKATRMVTERLDTLPVAGPVLSGIFRLTNATLGLPGAIVGSAASGIVKGVQEAISKGSAANTTLCGHIVSARFDGYRYS